MASVQPTAPKGGPHTQPALPLPRLRRVALPGPLDDNPDVQPVIVDGSKALSVGLSGLVGTGRAFLIDPADWHHVGTTMGARWLVINTGHKPYVCSTRAAAVKHSKQPAKKPVLLLARWLMQADNPWQNVRHRNGDTLDLRRCNLFIEDRASEWEAARRRREVRESASRLH